MARLVVITKGLPALPYDLNEKWVTIGRADGNLFQIAHSSVSGRHCEVRFTGGELQVRDLQSTNGTFVEGKGITEGTLQPGQTLRLGDVELKLEPGTSAATSAAGTPKINLPEPAKPAAVAVPKKTAETPDDPESKYQVLFVDDSMAFLESFTELCALLCNDKWQIHSAPTADRALAVLQEVPIDLVVLDIGMPMLDGLQLLAIIRRRYPAIKLAVMTGSATEARRADALAGGAELFIEKPYTPDGIKVVFNMLNDLLSFRHREGFTGALRQVNLQELIQMECIGRHSSILEIRNHQLRGQIYIETGSITHAVAGPLVGEKAFNQLLTMTGGEFQLKPFQPPVQRTVHGGWEFLLLEAARRSDEDTAFVTKKTTLSASASTSGYPPDLDKARNPAADAPQNPA